MVRSALLLFADATAAQVMQAGRALTAPARCTPGTPDEVTVCARRRAAPRLPLPVERTPQAGQGGRPVASAAPPGVTSCGVVDPGVMCAGRYRGNSAVAALARIVTAIVDPDALDEPVARPPVAVQPR